MRRERRIEFAAHRADRLRELAAHRVELRAAVVEHAIAPLEAEREAEVQQLEQVEMLARLLRQPLKQMKNFSPPHVSLWNDTSRLCDDHTLPPHGVSAAASSSAVHRQ